MSVRGADGGGAAARWSLSLRAIEGIPVDRARLRTTLSYALSADLQVGLEFNPLAQDIGPIANWRVLDETRTRPSLILGTSSDRIGTSHGRAFYATLSKDLEQYSGLPLAPYVGAAFGTYDDELVPIAGTLIRWRSGWSTTHLYDGHNLHHLVNVDIGKGRNLSLVIAEQADEYYFGLSAAMHIGTRP